MIKYDEFCVHCLKVCDLPRHPDEEARSRCVRIIEILISAKANINPRNSKGSTPLMWLVCSSMQYAESLWFSGKGRIVKGLCLHVNPQYLAAPSSWSFDWNGFERDSLLPFVTIAYRHVPLSCHASLRCACRQKNIEVVKLFLDIRRIWHLMGSVATSYHQIRRLINAACRFSSWKILCFAIWTSSLSESFRLSGYQMLILSHPLIAASNLREHRHVLYYSSNLPFAFQCFSYMSELLP